MRLRVVPPAKREMLRASLWYDKKSPGLGDRLLDEVAAGFRAILEHPRAHPAIDSVHRWKLLNVFPYAVIYRVEGDEIVVVAIAHLKRRRGYWRGRKTS